ncbi:MAG: NAD(P)-dependent oxidoreductase, partial [Bacteroidota bacterium]
EEEFSQMKPGSIFINLSRGFVVQIEALKNALKTGHLRGAAVDVFPQEPKSNAEEFISELKGIDNVILTPHIGGSTQEAQRNIADYVPARIIDYVNAGTTFNSVNFPALQLPSLKQAHRLIHLHRNEPGILAKINNILAHHHINIVGQYLKTDENVGYVITDVNKASEEALQEEMRTIEGTIRFRVLY